MKHSILLTVFVLFALSSSTQAQTSSNSDTWFGTSASLHYIIPSLDIHIGIEDALGENLDLRTTLGGVVLGSSTMIGVGLNGITNLSDESSGVKNYIGFGPRAMFLMDSYSPETNNIVLAVGGLWGTEFFTQNSTRPFIELNGSVPLTAGTDLFPAFLPILSFSTGVNFHF